ncbi:hypothetical protein V8F20_003325 [Naviculisporaceae sp. PSN 640]
MNNRSASEHNSDSTIGPRSTGGMASEAKSAATANLGNEVPKVFDSEGAIGKQFTKDGAIGSVGQKIGGPLAEDGMIGKRFTEDGAIGGTVQNTLGGHKSQTG